MSKSSVKTNYIFKVAYQLFAIFVPLITTPYISRVLGVEGVGTYSYTYSMVRYFWLLSALGTVEFGTRLVGIDQNNKEKRSYDFWNIFSIKFIATFITISLYILYVYQIGDNKFIALIQGINLIAVLFDITWFYQGMENFKSVSLKNFIIKILNIIYIFVFIKDKDDLSLYVFGTAFFLLVGNLSLWVGLRKYLTKIKIKKLTPLKYLKPVMQLFIPSISVQVFAILDKSMIGWFTKNPAENGYYEQAYKIVDMALVLITSLAGVLIPKVSRAHNEGNKEEIKKYMNKSFSFIWFLAIPLMLGTMSIAKTFVPIFFGPEYYKAVYVLIILSLLFIVMGLSSVTGEQYLISVGQYNKLTKILLLGGAVNISLNILLIPKLGAIGAAVGSVIGETIICIIGLIYMHKNIAGFDLIHCLKTSKKYLLAGISMFAFVIIVTNIISIQTLIGLCIVIALATIVYAGILLILKDEFVLTELSKLKRRLVKNND